MRFKGGPPQAAGTGLHLKREKKKRGAVRQGRRKGTGEGGEEFCEQKTGSLPRKDGTASKKETLGPRFQKGRAPKRKVTRKGKWGNQAEKDSGVGWGGVWGARKTKNKGEIDPKTKKKKQKPRKQSFTDISEVLFKFFFGEKRGKKITG